MALQHCLPIARATTTTATRKAKAKATTATTTTTHWHAVNKPKDTQHTLPQTTITASSIE